MNASYEIICKVYNHRKNTLKDIQDEILIEAVKTGKSSLTADKLNRTNLLIGGYEIDDFFLKKTSFKFFHYAKINMEVLYQIVND